LKARAWLDLTERAKRGEQIDSKTIKKHKNDVFRLYQILDPASDPEAPEAVKKDLGEFISRMRGEDVDLKSLGIRTSTREGVLAEIARVYRLPQKVNMGSVSSEWPFYRDSVTNADVRRSVGQTRILNLQLLSSSRGGARRPSSIQSGKFEIGSGIFGILATLIHNPLNILFLLR
jgi:hypothetical protein